LIDSLFKIFNCLKEKNMIIAAMPLVFQILSGQEIGDLLVKGARGSLKGAIIGLAIGILGGGIIYKSDENKDHSPYPSPLIKASCFAFANTGLGLAAGTIYGLSTAISNRVVILS
jgi:hypothetical protein